MKVILTQPPLLPGEEVTPPLGLCTLGAWLLSQRHEVRIVDLDLEVKTLREEAREAYPSLVHSCSSPQIARYLARISGPLLDRIDIQIEVPRLPHDDLLSTAPGESSAAIRERVCAARAVQQARVGAAGRRGGEGGAGMFANGAMGARQIRQHCWVGRRRKSYCGQRCSSWGCRRGRMIGS